MSDTPVQTEIIILGVGNILLSDEGFGVHLISLLELEYRITPEVRLVDGGTMGMELLGYCKGATHLLLLDAVKGKQQPGTVYVFNDDEVAHYFSRNISGHEVGIQDILYIHEMQEESRLIVSVVGVEPESLEASCELTDTVSASLPEVLDAIQGILMKWGVRLERTYPSTVIGASLGGMPSFSSEREPRLPNGAPVPGDSPFPEILL